MYSDGEDKVDKIQHTDLQQLATQLLLFIKVYRKNVYMDEPRYQAILNSLEDIGSRLKRSQYSSLIKDTSIIEYDSSTNYDLNDYPF
jgi:hypothetical protein